MLIADPDTQVLAGNTGGRVGVSAASGISCIVCAFNEGERIETILGALENHPALHEVIVVNDGSTDDTEALVLAHPAIRLISYHPNRGKTYAMARGIAAASGEYLMFLDADLSGLGHREIDQLAAPVTSGRAAMSISLRRNSLGIYRSLGLDFVSGERVVPTWLVRDQVATMSGLPRWGAESFINQRVIRAGLTIEVVDWPGVNNIRKYDKIGPWRGFVAELGMIGDALRVLTLLGVIRQNLGLLRLVNRRRPVAARRPSLASWPWRNSA